jgi:hypothetical protein
MGYIKEPPGIDFTIGEIPYTEQDAAITSAYIQQQKAKQAKKTVVRKKSPAKPKKASTERGH